MIDNSTSVSSFKKSDQTANKSVRFNNAVRLTLFEQSPTTKQEKAQHFRSIQKKMNTSLYMAVAKRDISKLKTQGNSVLLSGELLGEDSYDSEVVKVANATVENTRKNNSVFGTSRRTILSKIKQSDAHTQSSTLNQTQLDKSFQSISNLVGLQNQISNFTSYSHGSPTSVMEVQTSIDFAFALGEAPSSTNVNSDLTGISELKMPMLNGIDNQSVKADEHSSAPITPMENKCVKSVSWGSLFEGLGEFKYVGAQSHTKTASSQTVEESNQLATNPHAVFSESNTDQNSFPSIKRHSSNVESVSWNNLDTF
jgi:hypothetical protein